MDLTTADGGDVVERLPEQRGEFALAAGDGGDAELTRHRLTGRGVDAEHGQAVAVELGLHGGRRVIVGKLQLDRPKAGRGRRGETLDQRALGEKISEIGGEARHAYPSGVMTGRSASEDARERALDPAIHPSSKTLCEEDRSPGQARA